MAADLSKQDYLKRYLEGDDNKKRKKRVKTAKAAILPRMKIINNDIDIKSIKFGTDKEKGEDDDEDPIVAEVVDDRPVEVISKEMYESSRWKKIGDDSDTEKGALEKSPFSSESRKSSLTNKHKETNFNIRHDSDSDLSPVRVSSESTQPSSTNKHHKSNSNSRHDSDGDTSPVRVSCRHDSDDDVTPPQKGSIVNKSKSSDSSRINSSKSRQKGSDSDLSPVRPNRKQSSHYSRRSHNSDSDLSPAREGRRSPFKSSNHNSDSDLSPPRKSNLSYGGRDSSKDENYRPTKTLSGLKAGLQSASTLRKETKELRKRETHQIKQLDDELSGRNASTIVRDRQTGKKRDIAEENRVDEEKEKRSSETQQKYAEWGKGIKQSETQKQRLSEDMYEMSKPLARHRDDEDLEARLKAQIHEDDPMANYMRKKRSKGLSSAYPVYSGPQPPPNRFGIPPGYRWDGVDRSNGFEKKYFELKSSKKASEEEAYLWSVQDM